MTRAEVIEGEFVEEGAAARDELRDEEGHPVPCTICQGPATRGPLPLGKRHAFLCEHCAEAASGAAAGLLEIGRGLLASRGVNVVGLQNTLLRMVSQPATRQGRS